MPRKRSLRCQTFAPPAKKASPNRFDRVSIRCSYFVTSARRESLIHSEIDIVTEASHRSIDVRKFRPDRMITPVMEIVGTTVVSGSVRKSSGKQIVGIAG
jgi:hypothetical protein